MFKNLDVTCKILKIIFQTGLFDGQKWLKQKKRENKLARKLKKINTVN